MGSYVQNKQICCPCCGHFPVMGREYVIPESNGKTVTECKWVCTRCGRVARRDQKLND